MHTYSELRCVFRKRQNATLEGFFVLPCFFSDNPRLHMNFGIAIFFKQLVEQLCSEEYLTSTGGRTGLN